MNSPTCPQCDRHLPLDAPGGLCPLCLMTQAIELDLDETLEGGLDPRGDDTLLGRGGDSGSSSDADAGRHIRYFGDYELLQEVGRGAMGVVYRARQRSLDRVVAVKLLQGGVWAGDTARRRFLQEARAVASLEHPNIVGIHEVGEHHSQPFFSMDFVEGEHLGALLERGPIGCSQAAQWLSTLARAIAYAHHQGVLHRDLKPSNVLLDGDRLLITDFGLAKSLRPSGEGDPLTATGAVLGTPGYIPPERLRSTGNDDDGRGDIYSLGAMLFALLTGRPPHVGDTPTAAMLAALERPVETLRHLDSTIPRDLEAICLRCLAHDPEDRYDDAFELAEDLDRFSRGETVTARPLGPWSRSGRWLKRHRAPLAVVGTLLVLGWGLFWVGRRSADAVAGAPVAASGQFSAETSTATTLTPWMATRRWERALDREPFGLEVSADGTTAAALSYRGTADPDIPGKWRMAFFDLATAMLDPGNSGALDPPQLRRPARSSPLVLPLSKPGQVELFNPVAGRRTWVPLTQALASVDSEMRIAFDPAGRTVAWKEGATMVLFDTGDGAFSGAFPVQGQPSAWVDERHLLVVGDTLRLVDVGTSNEVWQSPPGAGILAISPTGEWAALALADGIEIWNLVRRERQLRMPLGDLDGAPLSGGDRWLLDRRGRWLARTFPSRPLTVALLDLRQPEEGFVETTRQGDRPADLLYSSFSSEDSSLALCPLESGSCEIWNLEAGRREVLQGQTRLWWTDGAKEFLTFGKLARPYMALSWVEGQPQRHFRDRGLSHWRLQLGSAAEAEEVAGRQGSPSEAMVHNLLEEALTKAEQGEVAEASKRVRSLVNDPTLDDTSRLTARSLNCHFRDLEGRRRLTNPPPQIHSLVNDYSPPKRVIGSLQLPPDLLMSLSNLKIRYAVTVDEEGCVADFEVLEGLKDLDEDLHATAWHWVYQPARMDGQPVAARQVEDVSISSQLFTVDGKPVQMLRQEEDQH